MLRFSLNSFPHSPRHKQKAGLMWACTVQPLSCDLNVSVPNEGSALSYEVARCAECLSYINPYVKVEGKHWICCLCNQRNQFVSERYTNSLYTTLPEICNPAIDYRMEKLEEEEIRISDLPVYLMVVDATQLDDKEYLSRVQEGITAAIEGMPETARFGLITFDSRIGIWDLQNILHGDDVQTQVYHIPISQSGKPSNISIGHLLRQEQFLVSLDENIISISNTIEKLGMLATTKDTRIGLGATIQLINQYFASFDNTNVKATLFLSGRPNYGIGAIPDLGTHNSISSEISFYKEEAINAVEHGICYDTIVFVPNENSVPSSPASLSSFLGFSSLRYLSSYTTGQLLVYSKGDRAKKCARDLFAKFSCAQAFHCMLRLRCPPEFTIGNAYGDFYEDENKKGLYHAQGCDPWKTFAFDFLHDSVAGFDNAVGRKTYLQIAFSHTYLPSSIDDPYRSTLERRLRVHTVEIPVSSSLVKILQSVDMDTTMLIMNHKLSKEIFRLGVLEVRALLQDWFTILLGNYNTYYALPKKNEEQEKLLCPANLDLEFLHFPALVPFPRALFELLYRSPLYDTSFQQFPDSWIYLQSLISGHDANVSKRLCAPSMLEDGEKKMPVELSFMEDPFWSSFPDLATNSDATLPGFKEFCCMEIMKNFTPKK